MEYLVVRKTDYTFFIAAHSIKIKSLSIGPNDAEIMTLLQRLKKDTNVLLNFILESKEKSVAAAVNTQMTAGELLAKCSDELKAKVLFELKGICSAIKRCTR